MFSFGFNLQNGSEQNYNDILSNRKREALITYNMFLKEQNKKYKQNIFNPDNWHYDEETDTYACPNHKRLNFQYHSIRTDRTGFERKFKIYECEDCTGCPFRLSCTKVKEGNNRKLRVNEKWEHQKEYVRAKLSEEKTSAIYRKRKIDMEPVFGFLKANLRFSRFSVRGKIEGGKRNGSSFNGSEIKKIHFFSIFEAGYVPASFS